MLKRLAALTMLSFLIALSLSPVRVEAQNPCSQGTAYRGCRACGKARRTRGNPNGTISSKTKWLNVHKNRDEKAVNVEVLTVQEIRDPANNGKFQQSMAVEVTGYVAGFDDGGYRESCNCGRADLQDIHINVVAKPDEANNPRRYLVVEITPRWQEKFGLNAGNYEAMRNALELELKNKWVTFQGWMLYDHIHADESESTAPGNSGNWRATPWEVHPVTSYKVLSGPPSE
jgi:hypothetical protein